MPKLPPKDYVQVVDFPPQIQCQPIGVVHSPYKERHGTPRQAQMHSAPADYRPVVAEIELFAATIPPTALKDLDQFEMIWVITWLHLNKHWNPTVIPPRGPRIPRGTLATRAPHRPNPLGLSATRLLRIEGMRLVVEGIDLLDQTPVLDIKPYIPYCDAFPRVGCGYVSELEQARVQEEDIFGQVNPVE